MPIENTNPSLARNPEYGRVSGQSPPLKKDDGRTPGGARRPDLNPTGFVNPQVVAEYSQEVVEHPERQSGAYDGLQRDRDTGHLIGIEQAPVVPHPDKGSHYPRWVTPHASHVVVTRNAGQGRPETGDFQTESDLHGMSPDKEGKKDEAGAKTEGDNLIIPRGSVVSVPGFKHHVRRHDGAIQVLVDNEEQEEQITGAKGNPDRDPQDHVAPHERFAAEIAYEQEVAARDAEAREKRITEIVTERRKKALEEAEKDLQERRKAIEAGPRHGDDEFDERRLYLEEAHNKGIAVNPAWSADQVKHAIDRAGTESQEDLEADRRDVGLEKSTADMHDRAGPGMEGDAEADSKIGPDDWTTRSGPVEVRPDKPFGNQGQT